MPVKAIAPFLTLTKLRRPRVSDDVVMRPRLLEALDQQRPLTLVLAPAGYGKTTLLSTWLGTCKLPSVWLSLDEHDNDPMVFLTYLLAALRQHFLGVGHETLAMINSAAPPPLPAIVGNLINELDTIDQEFVVVLDDYHLIKETAVHGLLAELLRHPPHSLDLLLSSRHDPPLQLATLRGRNQMTELRTRDLRFTPAEATAFLQRAMDGRVDEQTVAILEDKTEGWITGLHLAALFLRSQDNIAVAAVRLQGNTRFTMEYLAAEVLAQLTPDLHEFLIKTSVLDRLYGPLCTVLLDGAVSAKQSELYLEQLEHDNLFVVPLDDGRRWYRYHHLFQRLLQHQLQVKYAPEEIAALHARASAWLVANDFMEEAILHALATDDEDVVVRLIESQRHSVLNQEHWHELEQWLLLIPKRYIDIHPELLLTESWSLHKRMHLSDIPERLDRAELLLAGSTVPESVRACLQSEIDTLRSQQFYWIADAPRTTAFASRALATIPLEYATARGVAWVYAALGLHMAGERQAALDALSVALKEDHFYHSSMPARLLGARCHIHWMDADLLSLMQSAEELRQLARQRNLPESIAWANYYRGCARFHQDNLAGAESDFAAVVTQRDIAHGFTYIQSAFGLASAHQAQGNLQEARAVVETALAYVRESGNVKLLVEVQAFQAHLALAQGQTAEAHLWAAQSDRTVRTSPMPTFFVAALVLAEVLVHQDTPATLAEARLWLTQLQEVVEFTHNTRFLIELLALQTLLHARTGEEAEAQIALQRALHLAQAGGLRRLFCVLDPRLHLVQARLAQGDATLIGHTVSSSIAEPVLASPFPAAVQTATIAPGRLRAVHDLYHPDLIEMPTNREMDVLLLLSKRLTNKEIARELGITSETVKQHAVNLFRKLHVDNRRDAIVQARVMGVLPPKRPDEF